MLWRLPTTLKPPKKTNKNLKKNQHRDRQDNTPQSYLRIESIDRKWILVKDRLFNAFGDEFRENVKCVRTTNGGAQ